MDPKPETKKTTVDEAEIENIQRSIEELVKLLSEELEKYLVLMEAIEKDIEGIEIVIMISSGDQKTELESIRDRLLGTKTKLQVGIDETRKDITEHTQSLVTTRLEDEKRRVELLMRFDGLKQ